MSKLIQILSVILIAFALSSLFVYRTRLGGTLRPPRSQLPNLIEETKTVEGQIQAVDSDHRTLILIYDGEEVMLAFYERTAILALGRPVQAASIASGTAATVKYTQRGGKKWARKIEIARAEPAESSDSY